MQIFVPQCYRVMMTEKLSMDLLQVPETPAMWYPRGGISVCLCPKCH